MEASILTQKNVCALLGLIMAFTIVFKATATDGRPQQQVKRDLMNQKKNLDSVQEESIAAIEVDFSGLVQLPTI